MKLLITILFTTLIFNCKEDAFKKLTYSPVDYKEVKVEVKKQDTTSVALPEKKGIYAILNTSAGNIVLELFHNEAPKTVQNFIDLAQGEKETTKDDGKTQKIKFYNGLSFHRVIDGFMIQGGCPKGDGTGGPGYKFEDEINGIFLGLDKLKGTEVPFYDRFYQQVVISSMGVKSQEELEKRMKEAEEKIKKAREMSVIEVLHRIGYRFNEILKSQKPDRGTIAMANAGPNTNGSQFFINQVDNPHLTGLHTVFGKVVAGLELVDVIAKAGNSNTTINSVSIIDRR